MSNPIPIKRKFSAVNNKENIKYTNNFQQKKILNNKYKNHSQKDVSVPINSKLNNKIIEKYLNENISLNKCAKIILNTTGYKQDIFKAVCLTIQAWIISFQGG